MGRPKKIIVEEDKTLIREVSEILAGYCPIPGCAPRNHLPEVQEIFAVLEQRGIKLPKEGD